MPRVSRWLLRGLIAVPACVAYQVLVHSALIEGYSPALELGLSAVPLTIVGYCVVRSAHRRGWWIIVLGGIAAAIYMIEQRDHLGLAATNALTHTAINVFMLWFFGRTLFGGREPLITGFARKLHGTLPTAMERYTRRVTLIWTFFFAGQLLVSGTLLAFASLQSWSFFVNVLSLPLVALMFVLEYAYRIVRYRSFEHASILQGIEMFARGRRTTDAGVARDVHG